MSFSAGLKKIEQLNSLQNIVTADARRLLDDVIQGLNKKLIEQCLNKFNPSNRDSVMKIDVALHAVSQLFRDELRDHAKAEGCRALLMYKNGILSYTPKMTDSVTEKSGRKMEKKKKPLSTVFLKGIKDIRGSVYPDASLQPDAVEIISRMLAGVSTKISEGAKDSAHQGQTITLNDVRSALNNILPAELLSHALTEGAKMVFFLQSGGLSVAKSITKTLKKSDKMKPETLKKKKTSAIPSKKSRTVRSAKVPKSLRVPSKKTAVSISPRRKPRSASKTIKRPSTSRAKRAPSVSRKKRSPSKPSRKRKTSVIRAKPESPLAKKKKPVVLSRKKRSPAVSRKISKSPTSRKRRVPSKSPVSKQRRAVSVSGKKRTPSKSPASKRKAVSRKTTPSISPVSKQKRAVLVSRKKRITSKSPVSKRRAVSVSRKKTPSKSPVSKQRRVTSVSKKKTPPTKSTKTSSKKLTKKDKEVPTAVAGLTKGIKNLNAANYPQSLSSDALKLISSNLSSLLERLIAEIKKGKSSTVGAEEVRAAVLIVFPPELRHLALANLSRALTIFQDT